MIRKLTLPRLYPIIDASFFRETSDLLAYAQALLDAGIELLQYRNKTSGAGVMLEQAQALRALAPSGVRWIMNDRADLCVAAGFAGVHLGQDDLLGDGARTVVGAERLIGISTHNIEQFREAMATGADYIAIGPVFRTQSKQDPDPVVGLEGVRAARAIADRPMVAIGGITRENARSVLEAGADAVAVISDLLEPPAAGGHWLQATRKRVEAFLRVLG